jgi:hypothetical protein
MMMPGYADWKTLYQEEFGQLYEEGYSVGSDPQEAVSTESLPFPAQVLEEQDESDISEDEWEQAYWKLLKLKEKGIRADFPYIEPDEYDAIIAAAADVPALEPLTMDEYVERIRGAWFGRCGGVVLGKPLEMRYDRAMIQKYLESVDAYPLEDWVPARSEKLDITLRMDCIPSTRGNVRYTQPDDDIHYTVTSLLLAEEKGLDFTLVDVGMNLLNNIPYCWLWLADSQMYYHMVNMMNGYEADFAEDEVTQIKYRLNPWRECIDGQLKADLWGYITPGDPRAGSKYIYKQASFSLVKNGVYGGMFVAGCLSAALSKNPTVEKIIQGGLSVIPRKSRLAQAVQNVVQWYDETQDWIATCDKIMACYGHLKYADTINNLAMVSLALVHGQLDYHRTITTAVMAGIDVDCNGATAGSIAGAAVGYDNLDQRWIAPLNNTVKTVVADFGHGTISELVERTVALRRRMLEEHL